MFFPYLVFRFTRRSGRMCHDRNTGFLLYLLMSFIIRSATWRQVAAAFLYKLFQARESVAITFF